MSLTAQYIDRNRNHFKNSQKGKGMVKSKLDKIWRDIGQDSNISVRQARQITDLLVKYEKYLDVTELEEFEQRKMEFDQALSQTKKSLVGSQATAEEIAILKEDFARCLQKVQDTWELEESRQYEADVMPGLPGHPGSIGLEQWEACGDMGVEAWAETMDDKLKGGLQWEEGRPDEFNDFLISTCIDFWEDPDYLKKIPADGDQDNEKLELLWHQLSGITSMIQMFWTATVDGNGVLGALLADEVGLGKTAQIMSLLAFIMATRHAQRSGKEVPPVIRFTAELLFFCGQKDIPNAPHLIAVPTTLVGQMFADLKHWFRPHDINILMMPSMKKA
ncbi:hypothetical protein ARMGADRAFT_1039198 [Armillaria gallica]|uniref:SNF2 N-terminal domain-containing protein n=1 Tax=Armillaria gallica TaxID=47427 RepID=A0A2H3CJT4_ARMGA|nr:hypothetical protein ARMGADRAFT_1039198 [Armillaria gallica]